MKQVMHETDNMRIVYNQAAIQGKYKVYRKIEGNWRFVDSTEYITESHKIAKQFE